MKVKDVSHSLFPAPEILYQDNEFAVAWGTYADHGKRLAMRWTGKQSDPKDKGYPKLFDNPVWFIITPSIASGIILSLIDKKGSQNKKLLAALADALDMQ